MVGKTMMLLSMAVMVMMSPGEGDVNPGIVMAVSFMFAKTGLIVSIFKVVQTLFCKKNNSQLAKKKTAFLTYNHTFCNFAWMDLK